MTVPDLNKRYFSYELSDIEAQNTFLRDNRGFVSYIDRKVGMFRLDPSPWKKSEKNEIFVALEPPRPSEGKLVEVVVRETEKFKEIVSNEVKETKINYSHFYI